MKLLLCMAGNKGMHILDGVYILEKRPWQCLREVKERNNDSLTTNSIPGPAHPHIIYSTRDKVRSARSQWALQREHRYLEPHSSHIQQETNIKQLFNACPLSEKCGVS